MTQEKLKESARKTASEASATIKSTALDAAEATKCAASDAATKAADTVRHELRDRADTGKDGLADQGQRLASGLREMAADHGSESVQNRLLDTVANGVADVSEALRNRSVGSILNDVEGFARRNPGAFVAGAAVAGFALSRFARATSPFNANDGSAQTSPPIGSGGQGTHIAARSTAAHDKLNSGHQS